MRVLDKPYRSIWLDESNPTVVCLIDQRRLPFDFVIEKCTSLSQMAACISDMHLRGAPLIGAAAGFGMYLAALDWDGLDRSYFKSAAATLRATRPTAVNLEWALQRQAAVLENCSDSKEEIKEALKNEALAICELDVTTNSRLGDHALEVIRKIAEKKEGPVQILTHCNAGWLATVDWGTATAGMYKAHKTGIDLHVWVDETRPRNQGARITSWELKMEGISHTVIVDNLGGHLMQNGMVDMVIVGTDRTAANGDVANKIGTYLKALAAKDNSVPFYVAAPSSSIDFELADGGLIPIEERNAKECSVVHGLNADGEYADLQIFDPEVRSINFGFDVTPAKYITGIITEFGTYEASRESLAAVKKERDERS